MGNFMDLIMDVILALFAFFAVAPILLNTAAQFGVHKRFAKTMIEEEIISAEDVKAILPKKQLAGVIISVLVVAAAALVCCKTAPYGYFCAGLPLLAGFWKYRKVTQFNSLTIQRFQATFQDRYDVEKLNKYVSDMF